MAQKDSGEVIRGIGSGLPLNKGRITKLLKLISYKNKYEITKETTEFFYKIVTEETPNTEKEIMRLEKKEVIWAIYRMNFFEKIRSPVLDDSQIEFLYQRTVDLWGEAPTEPVGRWAEWNLWVTQNRRRKGIAITDVVAGDKKASDLLDSWRERHEAREERRKYHKMINYGRYELPDEVPPSIYRVVLGPFLESKTGVSEADTDTNLDELVDTEKAE